MSISFPRTMRARRADNPQWLLLGAIVALALVAIWLAWFLLARVGITATSTNAQVTSDGIIIAEFAPNVQSRVRVGQSASVQFGNATTVPVVVWRVTPQTNGAARVELVPRRDVPGNQPLRPGSARVQIEIESVSPATLLMRATGQ